MTVYIDDMYLYGLGKLHRMKMSHMIADKESELHAMAIRIGLVRKWYQEDHYDVSKAKRALAIQHGAVPIRLRTLAKMCFVRRVRGKLPKLHLAEIEWARLQWQLSTRREREQQERAKLQKGKGWKGNAARVRVRA
jgi:hypothetical protein